MNNTEEKKKLFDVLIDLICVFQRICDKYGLQYYAIAGTLLGAVRHKGFIPWDDDVDLAMPRDDYDRLLKLLENGEIDCDEPYFIQCPMSDPGFSKSMIRLRNSNTTVIPIKDAVHNYNHGAFIDIFPLDAIPENRLKKKIYISEINILTKFLRTSSSMSENTGTICCKTMGKIAYYLLYPFWKAGIFSSKNVFSFMNKVLSQYNGMSNKIGLMSMFPANERFAWKTEEFEETKLVEFETIKIKIPCKYDEILTKTYGDYMIPVQQPSEHGETIVCMDTPYKEYVKIHKQELQDRYYRYRSSI